MWFRLLHEIIPKQWKRIIKTTNDSCSNIVYLSHHLVKNNRIVALEKLHSKETYSFYQNISQNMGTSTSQQYFKTFFPHWNLGWKLIYLLTRILTKNTSLRAFQYKVLNNVLYLNHKLSILRLVQLLCVSIIVSIVELYNIFSAIATKIPHYGQKSYFILSTILN